VAVAAGGVGAAVPSPALGIVAAAGAALAAVVTSWESLIGFGTNAKLYQDAAINLAEIDLSENADLTKSVSAAELVLRRENSRWGQLSLKEHKPEKKD
jgi:hypothetical protein